MLLSFYTTKLICNIYTLPYTDVDMPRPYLCEKCIYLEVVDVDGYYRNATPYQVIYEPPFQGYRCKKLKQTIIVLRRECKEYVNINQTTMEVNEKGMVNIDAIPNEGEQYDIKNLPNQVELIAISETFKEAQQGKTAGLVITYRDRVGKGLSQKYGKVSGYALHKAMTKLKIKDTVELQKAFYVYELTAMRSGYPRMIPIRKAES